MNRRSFFGFACGGVVAAPAALLVGETPVQYAHGVSKVAPLKPIETLTIKVDTTEMQDMIATAVRQVEENIRRGNVVANHRHQVMRG